MSSYLERNYRFSYLCTKDGLEVDFVIERPGMPPALVEIKSAERISDDHLRALRMVKNDFPNAELLLLCQDNIPRLIDGVHVLPWRLGLERLGLTT